MRALVPWTRSNAAKPGQAKQLIALAKQNGSDIPVPTDVVCAKEFSETAAATVKKVNEVSDDDLIMDIGPETAKQYAEILTSAKTIVWNGPVGVFEFDQFGGGTKALAEAIADSPAFSIAGGGDTLAAIDKYGISDKDPIHRPAEALSWNSSKARNCRL